jgi:hypothetical protein
MKSRCFGIVALVAVGTAGALPAAAQEPLRVTLACNGQHKEMEQRTATGTVRSPDDSTKSAEVKTSSMEVVYRDARIGVIVADGAGKFRASWGALLGKRTPDGWYPIDDLTVSDDMIAGTVKRGLLRAKLRIDRRTGDVDYGGEFKGVCERVADNPEARKF